MSRSLRIELTAVSAWPEEFVGIYFLLRFDDELDANRTTHVFLGQRRFVALPRVGENVSIWVRERAERPRWYRRSVRKRRLAVVRKVTHRLGEHGVEVEIEWYPGCDPSRAQGVSR